MKKITFLLLVLLLLLSMISCNSPQTTDKTDDGSDDTSEKNNESTDDSIGDKDDDESDSKDEEDDDGDGDGDDDVTIDPAPFMYDLNSMEELRERMKFLTDDDAEYVLDFSSVIPETEISKIVIYDRYYYGRLSNISYQYKNSALCVFIGRSPFTYASDFDFDIVNKTSPIFESIEEIHASEYSGYCFLKNDICGVLLEVNESSRIESVRVCFDRIKITLTDFGAKNKDALRNEIFSNFDSTEKALAFIEKIVSLIPESKRQIEDNLYIKLDKYEVGPLNGLRFDSVEKLVQYVNSPEDQCEIKLSADDYVDIEAFIPSEEIAAVYLLSTGKMKVRTVSGRSVIWSKGNHISTDPPYFESSDMEEIFKYFQTPDADYNAKFVNDIVEVELRSLNKRSATVVICNGEHTIYLMNDTYGLSITQTDAVKDCVVLRMFRSPENMLDIIENVANAFPKSE